jgi:glycosyltransferase involved in cell wall biosynthesis
MGRPIIHLYAICWNEAYMLPYFFRHYDDLVDRYVVFDNGSTDETVELLGKQPKVDLRHLTMPDPNSAILSGKRIHDNCWKESRGRADWVIVTDMDEHIYHHAFMDYIAECRNNGVTLIPGTGYQMLSSDRPDTNLKLSQVVTKGAPFAQMNKLTLFDPNRVTATNFAVGRHTASPAGEIVYPARDEVLNLHYKYLSLERTHERNNTLYSKLGKMDKEMGWGHKYTWNKERLVQDWELFNRNAVDNVMLHHDAGRAALHSGREKPWWRQDQPNHAQL